MNTIERLKQRKLFQWTLAYCAAAWAVVEVLDFLTSRFGWSESILRVATVVLASGIGVVLVVAWYHGERGAQRVSALELALLAVVLCAGGISAFAVGHGDAPEGASVAPQPPPDDGSIALVPFRNLSTDPEHEHDAAIFTDGLSTALAEQGLPVVAPSGFEGQMESVRKVALELSTRYLLEGSVRGADSIVRVTARLVTAESARQVWTEDYVAILSPAGISEVLDRIARGIVAALRVRLVPQQLRLSSDGTRNQQALNAYVAGLGALAAVGPEENLVAAREFSRALELDPDFAYAHSGLAFANVGVILPPPDRLEEGIETARRAARRALELDSTLSEPHVVLARIAELDGDTADARRQLERAIRKDPASGWAHYFLGILQFSAGHRAGALAQVDTLLRLNPITSWNYIRAVNILTLSGEFARSDTIAAVAEQLIASGAQPTWALYWNLGTNALMRGDLEAAARFLDEGFPAGVDAGVRLTSVLKAVAAAQRGPGTAGERRRAALAIVERQADSIDFPWAFTLYRFLDRERMYALLEERLRSGRPVSIHGLEFRPVRDELRFQELFAKYRR